MTVYSAQFPADRGGLPIAASLVITPENVPGGPQLLPGRPGTFPACAAVHYRDRPGDPVARHRALLSDERGGAVRRELHRSSIQRSRDTQHAAVPDSSVGDGESPGGALRTSLTFVLFACLPP